MKKRQKKLLGLLLACAMVCLPVSQAAAAISYDASAGVTDQVVFPGDSLINMGEGVAVMKDDGTPVTLDTPGTWTNTDDGTVYKASSSEDGLSLVLTKAGKVLTVEYGESSKNDDSDDTSNHYTFLPEETPDIPMDIAYYQAGETVKIKAEEPAEGMEFAGWTADTTDVVFEDASSPETKISMPDSKVKITANYQTAQSETQAAEPDAEDGNGIDPNAGGEGTTDPSAGGDVVADPSAGGDGAVDPSAGGNGAVDPNAGNEELIVIGDSSQADSNSSYGSSGSQQPAQYTLTVNDGTGSGTYTAGSEVSISAADYSDQGYAFNGWFVDTLNATLYDTSAASTAFIMPEANVTVSAQYQAAQAETQPETPATYNVTVNNGLINDESGATSFAEGAQVTVTANDRTQEGLTFTGWMVESGNVELADSTSATVSFTMPAGEVTISATYETTQTETPETNAPETKAPETEAPKLYEVVVENGTGSGTYEAGATVTVEANTEEGQEFQNWQVTSGDTSVDNPTDTVTTFTMPEEDVVVTAEYNDTPGDPATYNVTINGGTSSATGGVAEKDDSVQITATEQAGKRFVSWSGTYKDAEGNDQNLTFADSSRANTTFTMPATSVAITAHFVDVYTITVANGVINGSSATSTEVTSGSENVKITANPNPAGQAFSSWKITDAAGNVVAPDELVAPSSTSSEITINSSAVDRDLIFTAQYEGVQYKVTVNDGSANYATTVSGTVVTITANKAPEGMEFDYWKVDSANVSLADASNGTTTFTMPTADVTVSAVYKLKDYSLTVQNGTGDQDFYNMGDVATVSSNYPASGKEFDEWVAVSGNVEFDEPDRWETAFEMPASDVTVKATYKDGPSPDNNAILDLVAGGEYYTGDTIKFTASGAGMDNTDPNPGDYRYRPTGYQIGNVTGSWKDAPYTTSMAIKTAGEYTLKVTFAKEVFDGSSWVADGTTDTKSVTFKVIVKAAGVATGDDTPIAIVIAIAAVSCVLFIILLVLFLKRRKRR